MAYNDEQYYQKQGVCYDKILKGIVEALTGRKVPLSDTPSGAFVDRLKQYTKKEVEGRGRQSPNRDLNSTSNSSYA